MEEIDLERMRRALERSNVLPPTAGAPETTASRRPEEGLRTQLFRELELESALSALFSRCQTCRRTLQGVLRRSRQRQRRLALELFVDGRGDPPRRGPARQTGGVITRLRGIVLMLEELARGYDRLARERREEPFRSFARQCRQDAETVRNLLERTM